MDVETYKLDEKQMTLNHTLTTGNRDTSVRWRKQLLDGGLPEVQILMKAINNYAPVGTCLDVGSADGAQYFGLRKFFPKVKWTGCEISQDYIDLFIAALKTEGIIETPETIKVIDYRNLSIFTDNSFDVVTSRSVLSHYSPEHGFLIIDEMLRVAKIAVLIKFYQLPYLIDDEYKEGFANLEDRGYFVSWAVSKWDNYIKNKKAHIYQSNVFVIEK
jgi:ubiquinone/menaquinone biosynthesis C-methylase UbiE